MPPSSGKVYSTKCPICLSQGFFPKVRAVHYGKVVCTEETFLSAEKICRSSGKVPSELVQFRKCPSCGYSVEISRHVVS